MFFVMVARNGKWKVLRRHEILEKAEELMKEVSWQDIEGKALVEIDPSQGKKEIVDIVGPVSLDSTYVRRKTRLEKKEQ